MLSISGLLVAGAASAQSTLEYAELWSAPNEFYLDESASRQSFSFDETRPVRICVKDVDEAQVPTPASAPGPSNVALDVEHDGGKMVTVKPGDCAEIQARSLEISPAGMIATGWTLQGTIETREPKSNS